MARPFFTRLIDGKDNTADSLVFGALVAIFGIIALSAYDVIGQKHEFYPMNFGGGVAAILAGLGGGKMVRDRWSNPDRSYVSDDPPYLPLRQRPDNPDAR